MLDHEITKLFQEIDEFSQRLLPELANRDPSCFGDYLHGTFDDWRRKLRRLEDWQHAAERLSMWVKNALDGQQWLPDPDDLNRFMIAGAPDRHFEIRDGNVYWQLSMHSSVRWEDQELHYIPDACRPNHTEGLIQSIDASKQWFRQASVLDSRLWNALCKDLPALAHQDPEFAMSMLDPAAYRDRISSNSALSPLQQNAERAKVAGLHFRHVLNNAFLHVVAALANNHFMEIWRFLNVPCVSGRYTSLIPHYLFAILFIKADVLLADAVPH